MQTYASRLRKEDGAQVVRIRWYGERTDNPEFKVWVERKVHREPWTGDRSFKVVAILSKGVPCNFIKGVLDL
jgi:SPX domain protein involved in polyphosphate accumulation